MSSARARQCSTTGEEDVVLCGRWRTPWTRSDDVVGDVKARETQEAGQEDVDGLVDLHGAFADGGCYGAD